VDEHGSPLYEPRSARVSSPRPVWPWGRP